MPYENNHNFYGFAYLKTGFLHNRRIIHRDLKPENVVLKPDENGRIVFKLIDLGYAKELGQSSLALSFVGTLQYIAPEIFLSKEYTKSVDYWSLGFICFEVITGQRPFLPNLSPGQWMERVQNKSHDVICIYENVGFNEQDEGYEIKSSQHLFAENHLSRSLARDFESWLRVLLEWDPSKRGRNNEGRICLFEELTEIVSKTRINVVCMDRAEHKLDYVVNENTFGRDLQSWIQTDTGIDAKLQLLILSNGRIVHPNDLVLTSLGSMIDEGVRSFITCFVFSSGCVLRLHDWMKGFSLNIPSSVQPFLQNPRLEVTYPKRKQVYSHAYFFIRREQEMCSALIKGLKTYQNFLQEKVRELNGANRVIEAAILRCSTKFDFFKESLHHDLEKYRLQSKQKDRITSRQMFDSWVRSEVDLESEMSHIKANVEDQASATNVVNKKLVDLQRSLLPGDTQHDLSEYLQKSQRRVESLRRIPVEGRKEKENVMDMAQLIVKTLKQRDRFLQEHFKQRLLLDDLFLCTSRLARSQEKVLQGAELFLTAVGRLQRRRQSDLWKLLAAAVGQKTPPSPMSPNVTEDAQKLVAENAILRRQMGSVIEEAKEVSRSDN